MTARRIAFAALSLAVSASSVFGQTPPRLSLKAAEQRALDGHPDIEVPRAAAQTLTQTGTEARHTG
jgi:hypothetical protein